MQALRTAGLGLSLALSGSAAWAQAPGATFGPIRSTDTGEIAPVAARGQIPDVRPGFVPPRMPYQIQAPAPQQPPTQPMQPQPGEPFGPVRPAPQPMVTELRDANGQIIPVAPPIYGTAPIYGAPTYVAPADPYGGYGAPAVVAGDPFLAPGSGALFPRLNSALIGPGGQQRLTLSADYLLWFVKGQALPPLVTTSSPASNGIIGRGDTQILYGDGVGNRTLHSGGRFWANYWFPDCAWGVDGGVWFVGRNSSDFNADSSKYPLLARPFLDVNNNQSTSQLTAFPTLATGSILIHNQTSAFGAEANFRRGLWGTPWARVDGIIGFKNTNLFEELSITETFTRLPGAPAAIGVPGANGGIVQDDFRTENHFYGVNVGLSGEIRRGRWYANSRLTVGLGQVVQTADVIGYQNIAINGVAQRYEGGLLALPGANIGHFVERHFGVVPEVGANVGYYLTPNLRVGFGYNFLYMNSVIRPNGALDTRLDVNKIPNYLAAPAPTISATRPTVIPFRTSDLTIQGVNFSLQWTW